MCTAVSGRNVNKATLALSSSECLFTILLELRSKHYFMGVSVNVCDIFNSLNFDSYNIEYFTNIPPLTHSSENVYIQTHDQNLNAFKASCQQYHNC